MSNLIDWTHELSVGIEVIDDQHKILVNLLNQMNEAIQQHHGSDVANKILADLVDYTRIHFAVEEGLMRILDYPGYEEHHEAHKDLLEQVLSLVQKVTEGKATVSFELMHFLNTWLTKHILGEDMAYSSYFLSANLLPHAQKKSWLQKLMGK